MEEMTCLLKINWNITVENQKVQVKCSIKNYNLNKVKYKISLISPPCIYSYVCLLFRILMPWKWFWWLITLDWDEFMCVNHNRRFTWIRNEWALIIVNAVQKSVITRKWRKLHTRNGLCFEHFLHYVKINLSKANSFLYVITHCWNKCFEY